MVHIQKSLFLKKKWRDKIGNPPSASQFTEALWLQPLLQTPRRPFLTVFIETQGRRTNAVVFSPRIISQYSSSGSSFWYPSCFSAAVSGTQFSNETDRGFEMQEKTSEESPSALSMSLPFSYKTDSLLTHRICFCPFSESRHGNALLNGIWISYSARRDFLDLLIILFPSLSAFPKLILANILILNALCKCGNPLQKSLKAKPRSFHICAIYSIFSLFFIYFLLLSKTTLLQVSLAIFCNNGEQPRWASLFGSEALLVFWIRALKTNSPVGASCVCHREISKSNASRLLTGISRPFQVDINMALESRAPKADRN